MRTSTHDPAPAGMNPGTRCASIAPACRPCTRRDEPIAPERKGQSNASTPAQFEREVTSERIRDKIRRL
jgi:hypothetical protein